MWCLKRHLNNLSTYCSVCLSGISGLVLSGCGGSDDACCPGLPAGQVRGQILGSGAPEEALSCYTSQRPADSAPHQTGGYAGSQRPVRQTLQGIDVWFGNESMFTHVCSFLWVFKPDLDLNLFENKLWSRFFLGLQLMIIFIIA